ncbi:MAG: hypothetical protein ACRD3M_05410 [Thermoanaerobaculia bacterium]
MEEEQGVIGFLANDGVLYCSKACATREGKRRGREVDQEEYEALLAGEDLPWGSLCPGCYAEFPVVWPESDRLPS